MLARKKQEWNEQLAETPVSTARNLSKPNIALRGKCLVMGIFVVIIAVIVTMGSEVIIRGGYDLVRLKTQAAGIEKENEALRVEIAKLKSSQRIQQIAMNELGMVMPKDVYCASIADKQIDTRNERAVKDGQNPVEQFFGLLQHAKAEAGKRQ